MKLGPSFSHAPVIGAALCAVSALGAAGPAAAQGQGVSSFGPAIDWSVLARLRETVELDSNRRLEDDSNFSALGTVGLDFVIGGVGKRGNFTVNTGFTVGRSTDSGSDNLNRIDPNVNFTGRYRLSPLLSFVTSLNARTASTSVTEIEDSGEVDINATRFDLGGSAGFSLAATKRDSLSLSATAQIVDFSNSVGSFTPSQTFGLNASWSRRATETTTYSFSGGFRQFDADGANGNSSRTFRLTAGINHRRTPRHTLGGTFGMTQVSTDRSDGTSTNDVGFVGAGTFGYQLDDLSAGLNFNQALQPSSDGELDLFSRLSGNLSYRVNSLQSLGVTLNYVRRSDISGGGDVLQFLTLGPNYNYALTEDTSLRLGYQFRVGDSDTDGFRTSHRVTLSLSHDLTLLP